MKDKIIEILKSAWEFIKAVSALVLVAFLISLILFLGMAAIFGAVWLFDFIFLGGAFFG